jgi:hypothetical protein
MHARSSVEAHAQVKDEVGEGNKGGEGEDGDLRGREGREVLCGWMRVNVCLRGDAGVERARRILQLHCSSRKIKAKFAGPNMARTVAPPTASNVRWNSGTVRPSKEAAQSSDQ